jgi:O-succinylbenzoate synthase
MDTPICLDESIKNLNDVKVAISLGSCRIINIKQGRVGGLSASKTISEYCQRENTKVWSGGMLETGIGRSFNIHLQTLPGFVLPGDTSETTRYFMDDIVHQPVILDKEGFISIPQGPGIGATVSLEKLNKFKIFYEKW